MPAKPKPPKSPVVDREYPVRCACCPECEASGLIRKRMPRSNIDDEAWQIRCEDGEWVRVSFCPWCSRNLT